MDNEKYKYDVAFSFLQKDENIAVKLNDLLQGRFKTFIYSENQAELAGKDGEKIFNKVLGEESRVVVILYRNDWGKTKWTRIETTAIKNRAFDDGYDFSLFIPLESNFTLPKWLPKTQIWYNYDRWGIDGASSVIEFKIQQEGGIEKAENVSDKAARIDREIDFKKKREDFLNSTEGVKAANDELPILFNEIEIIVKDIEQNKHLKIGLNRNRGGRAITLTSLGYDLHLEWIGGVINSLSTSYLYFGLWKRPSIFRAEKDRKKIFEHEIKFDRSFPNINGWMIPIDNKFYLSSQFAEFCVSVILDKIRNAD